MKNTYLFDLDSTITREEILPTISKKIGKEREMRELTEKTMMGDIPFRESFTSRVDILKDIPVQEVSQMVAKIALNEQLVQFINENVENTYIITSNLDVWIKDLMKEIGMENHYFCSKARVEGDKIIGIEDILTKEYIIDKFEGRIIAVGDGSNDRRMVEDADIGIAFGGVRSIAPTLLEVADYAIYDEKKLCDFLKQLGEE